MGRQVAETRNVSASPFEGHLEPHDIAAFVDRTVDDGARARIESHLAQCEQCRAEIVEAARIVATLPRARGLKGRHWGAIAAAAVVLLVAWPRDVRDPGLQHREAPVTTTVAPRTIAPLGVVDAASTLTWSSVPHADRYRVRVFDADGSVLWDRETSDTTAALPAATVLRAARAYYWKVEARTGFDRSTASELTEFSIRAAPRQ